MSYFSNNKLVPWVGLQCVIMVFSDHTHLFVLIRPRVVHKSKLQQYKQICEIQSNFGRSNSPVSNTRDRSNLFVSPGNFPIHLMLKFTPGSNSDGSNSRTHSTVRRAIFHVKTL